MTENSPQGMTFLQHLEELRDRLKAALFGVAVGVGVAWFFREEMKLILIDPFLAFLPEDQRTLTFITPAEPFAMFMKISLIVGIFLSSPWLFYQLWRFISPALKKNEKRWALPFVLFTSLSFMGGVVFCYKVILPYAFQFFFTFGTELGFTNQVTLASFWSFESKFMLGMGLIFELPVLIFLLSVLGLVNAKMLLKGFRWAIFGAFVVAAIITPTPDPVNQSLVAGPLIVLYLIGILIAAIFGRKKD